MSASHAGSRRERPKWRRLRFLVLGILLLLVLVVSWVGVRGYLASQHLQKAASLADSLQTQVVNSDGSSALATARGLRDEVRAARDLTSDPVWRSVEVLPGAGDDMRAVRQVAEVLSAVSEDVVLPVAGIAHTVGPESFRPIDGAIDLAPLLRVQPAVGAADASLKAQVVVAAGIDASTTIGPIQNSVSSLLDVLQKASGQMDVVARAVALAPQMMGAEGPRNYLVMFQNNAELRATGGIPGAVALLHVEDGRLSLVQQASSSDFPRADAPVLPLPPETEGLYGAITGQYIQDVNLTPQFPLSAQLAREMWKRQFGTTVDGVLSMDPVALSYLMAATGPITLPTGDVLTSDNVVPLLLSEAYSRYEEPAQQDLFFAGTASGVFSAVASGSLDPKVLVSALTRAGDERRIYLWSADPDEQARIAETTLAGQLPTSTPSQPRFGMYLNDGTGAKMDYYLGAEFGVGQEVCRQDGRSTYVVEVTLRNDAPADAATSLPPYVTGDGNFGIPPGQISTNLAVYAPSEGVFMEAAVDGQPAGVQTATDSGHAVVQLQTTLSPGQSTTIKMSFLGGPTTTGAAQLETTPIVNLSETQQVSVACESPLT
ncbi:DUF4012 domain-containing protein [Frigoribacterium sp. NBH87]|uniref:DUF4012 domain-containing protein n=1 Tax=Frigoribacterium sp. NBH87 TaxID=2596916 RepID=UPI001624560E|nr:DUF4012 domain-containing protein [Frigoribacterium sp. NBH87]QNE44939.1 DUF4012 domain-containing protein [Frigoribacterium sp. NBH87]